MVEMPVERCAYMPAKSVETLRLMRTLLDDLKAVKTISQDDPDLVRAKDALHARIRELEDRDGTDGIAAA